MEGGRECGCKSGREGGWVCETEGAEGGRERGWLGWWVTGQD